jgi:hypothetical protein
VDIPTYLLGVTLSAGIKYGQKFEWDSLFGRYKSAASNTEQALILRSLAATPDKTLLARYRLYLALIIFRHTQYSFVFTVFIITFFSDNRLFVSRPKLTISYGNF